MTTYARIVNGTAVEIFIPPSGFTLAQCFPPATAALFSSVPDGTQAGATIQPGTAIAAQAAAMLSAGCQIVCTSASSLNGLYSCSAAAQVDIQAEMISILANGVFTNGQSTFPWADVNGTMHTFTVAQFKEFATALGSFVSTLTLIEQTNSGTLPSASATIA